MAQLGVQYPSLEGLMGGVGGYATGQRMDIARQNESINQAQALQDMFHQQQMDPIKLRQAGLSADQTEAGLGGILAESKNKQRNLQVRESIPLDVESRAALSKLAAQISEDEWKQEENAIQQALVSPSAAVRQQAAQLLPLFKEFQMERMKNADRSQRDTDLANLNHRNAMALADKNNAAGRYAKGAGGAAKSVEDRVLSGKMSFEQAATFFQNAAVMAELEGDTEKAAIYRSQAQGYAQKVAEKAQAASNVPKAGTIDPSTLNKNFQTVPERQPMPFPSAAPQATPAAPPAQKPPTLMDVQKMYPGVPPEKLKEAFKKKFGVDLQ